MSQDMRKLLNIMESEVTTMAKVDPKIVDRRNMSLDQLKKRFDELFNKSGQNPLIMGLGEPILFNWIDGDQMKVTPTRFIVETSTANPIGLKMDMFAMHGNEQLELPFNQTDDIKSNPNSPMTQASLPGFESAKSDYNFLRTPLWEQAPRSDVLMQYGDGGKIVITANIPGKSPNDLVRKAFLIEYIWKVVLNGASKTMLINMSGNDQKYLTAVARRHNLIYQDA